MRRNFVKDDGGLRVHRNRCDGQGEHQDCAIPKSKLAPHTGMGTVVHGRSQGFRFLVCKGDFRDVRSPNTSGNATSFFVFHSPFTGAGERRKPEKQVIKTGIYKVECVHVDDVIDRIVDHKGIHLVVFDQSII